MDEDAVALADGGDVIDDNDESTGLGILWCEGNRRSQLMLSDVVIADCCGCFTVAKKSPDSTRYTGSGIY